MYSETVSIPDYLCTYSRYNEIHEVMMIPFYFAFPSVPYELSSGLPNDPGIYIVVNSNQTEILYIGMSKRSIKQRWSNHQKKELCKQHGADRIYYLIEINTELRPRDMPSNDQIRLITKYGVSNSLSMVERFYIRMYRPKLNQAGFCS
jgi:hypothetical protein